MRSTSLLLPLVVAACTSSGPTAGSPELVPETPDRVDTMACGAALPDACPTCDFTLDAALADPRFCGPGFPGSVERCDSFDIVGQTGIDTATGYFYRDGQLTAIVGFGPDNRVGCTAGPQTFDVPHCNHEHAVVLPACATH
jgi:hypothetical protein